MANRKIEIIAGVFFAVILLIIGLFGFLWCKSAGIFENKTYTLKCYFDEIAGLTPGAPIFLMGKPIGTIKEIQLNKVELRKKQGVKVALDTDDASEIFDPNPGAADEKKKNFMVGITIEREYQEFITSNSIATMRLTSSLGISFAGGIDISLGHGGSVLKEGNILTAQKPEQLRDLQDKLEAMAKEAVDGFNVVSSEAEAIVKDVRATITSITHGTKATTLGSIVNSIDVLLQDFSSGEMNRQVSRVLGNVEDLMKKDNTRISLQAVKDAEKEIANLKLELKKLKENAKFNEDFIKMKNRKKALISALENSTLSGVEKREFVGIINGLSRQEEIYASETAELFARIEKVEKALVKASEEEQVSGRDNLPTTIDELNGILGNINTLLKTMELDNRFPRILDLTEKNLENIVDITGGLKKHWLISSYMVTEIPDPQPEPLLGHSEPY